MNKLLKFFSFNKHFSAQFYFKCNIIAFKIKTKQTLSVSFQHQRILRFSDLFFSVFLLNEKLKNTLSTLANTNPLSNMYNTCVRHNDLGKCSENLNLTAMGFNLRAIELNFIWKWYYLFYAY